MYGPGLILSAATRPKNKQKERLTESFMDFHVHTSMTSMKEEGDYESVGRDSIVYAFS